MAKIGNASQEFLKNNIYLLGFVTLKTCNLEECLRHVPVLVNSTNNHTEMITQRHTGRRKGL